MSNDAHVIDDNPARKKQKQSPDLGGDEKHCEAELQSLHHWLRSEMQRDVLIPVAIGEKRPCFPYKDGAWTWDKFDAFVDLAEAGAAPVDWAIVLRDVCVVDVDSPHAAEKLELDWPVLTMVPCEDTAKGRHYFFRRSAMADAAGFWDGAAQVLEQVDFKSVTSTGTGGVIVVTPSTGKSWVRTPWTTALIDIPDDLLAAIAVPTPVRVVHPLQSFPLIPPGCLPLCVTPDEAARLPMPPTPPMPPQTLVTSSSERAPEATSATCGGGIEVAEAVEDPDAPQQVKLIFLAADGTESDQMLVSGARLALLRTWDFCAALLSGRWEVEKSEDGVPTLQLQCESYMLEELFSLHESGSITNERAPTAKLLWQVETLSDMLGARRGATDLLLERATFWADLFRLSPEWWYCSKTEQKHMLGTSPEASDAQLMRIDDDLAQVLGYEPMRTASELWLYRELPHAVHPSRAGYKVLREEPNKICLEELPPPVMSILKAHHTCVAAAGGAVLGGVARWVEDGTDVDLFVYGLDQEASSAVMSAIETLVATEFADDAGAPKYAVSRSPAAVTFTLKTKASPKDATDFAERRHLHVTQRSFQVILGLHRARSQILEYFDLAPTKVLARMDAEKSELIVEALPSFVESLRRMAFHVDAMYWSPSSVERINKYIVKGFECAVPGVRRAAFSEPGSVTMPAPSAENPRLIGGRSYCFMRKRSEEVPGREISRYGARTRGLSVLFDAEDEVLRSRKYWSQTPEELEKCEELVFGGKDGAKEVTVERFTMDERLTSIEVATIASKIAGKLGTAVDHSFTSSRSPPERDFDSGEEDYYSDDGGGIFFEYGRNRGATAGTYGFIRESFRCAVAVRVGDERRGVDRKHKFWTFTDAGRFKPAAARLEELYDKTKLEQVAQAESEARAKAVHTPGGFGTCAFCCAPCALIPSTIIPPCPEHGGTYYCSEEHKEADRERHQAEYDKLMVDSYVEDGTDEDGADEDEEDKDKDEEGEGEEGEDDEGDNEDDEDNADQGESGDGEAAATDKDEGTGEAKGLQWQPTEAIEPRRSKSVTPEASSGKENTGNGPVPEL